MNSLEKCFEVGDDGLLLFNKDKNRDFGLSHNNKPQQKPNRNIKLNKEQENIFDTCMTVK